MPAQGLKDLDAVVEQYATSNFSPSGIVTVAKGGEIVETRTWGGDGYDVTTPFRIASCTKSFTALALLILRREGRLGLDDEVVRHVPELQVVAPEGWPVLRLRHLLAMSGGLATDNPWGDRQESRSREQLSAWLAGGLRLDSPPGDAYEYSNLGYAVLGEVITRVSGQDFKEFVRERIIDPLGLPDTRFAADDLPTTARGYHREPMLPGQPGGWTVQRASGPGVFSPIGGLYSSARDLVAWAHLHMHQAVPVGATFTAADLAEGQQPLTHVETSHAPRPLRGLVTRAYGYGLNVERFTDHGVLVSHAGGYPGFTAYMCWHADSGHTVIASANGTHSGVPDLARRVMFPLMVAGGGSPAAIEPWPETLAAARAVDDLVREARTGSPAEVAERYARVFAENAELDFPLARRVEYLRQAFVNLGELRPRGEPALTHERPARAGWSVPAEFGKLELYIELAPVAPFGVQTFEVVVQNGWGKVELF